MKLEESKQIKHQTQMAFRHSFHINRPTYLYCLSNVNVLFAALFLKALRYMW